MLSIDAPAKVNLVLSVGWPPVDGYHPVESVMCALGLCDTLRFEVRDALGGPGCGGPADARFVDARPTAARPADARLTDVRPDGVRSDVARTTFGTSVAIECTGPCAAGADVAVADNLVFRAIDAFERQSGRPLLGDVRGIGVDGVRGGMLSVCIDKHIPAGGGLGGGSSDAAAALLACARIAPSEGGVDLDAVARGVGADVPFFLHGGTAFMGGRGDVFERALPGFGLPVVLLGDEEGSSTSDVYAAFDALCAAGQAARAGRCDARALADALDDGCRDAGRLAELCGNDLGPAACTVNPVLAHRLDVVRADPDVLAALVSGSGSTCFAVCADADRAAAVAERARAWCAWTCVARPV